MPLSKIESLSAESPYIFDQAGNKVFKVDTAGNKKVAINATYETDVAQGLITGVEAVNKFGRVVGVNILDPPVDVWDGAGIYTGFPAVAEAMEIVSSSANDIGAGSGARTVTISNLLDANKNIMPDVTVTLNGITPVSLGTQTYSRATRIRVATVGATGSNEGDLTLSHSTTVANIFAVVGIGKNGTRQMTYTTPAGYTLYVNRGNVKLARANGSNGSANCTIKIREDRPDAPFVPIRDFDITQADAYSFENGGFFVFPEKIDLKVTVESVSDDATNVMSEFDGYLIENV